MTTKPHTSENAIDMLQRELTDAVRIRNEIGAKLEAARSVSASLDAERQVHLVGAACGDEAAIAALNKLKIRAAEHAGIIADLEGAFEAIKTRVAGCVSRLREAENQIFIEELTTLSGESAKMWDSIGDLCTELQTRYAEAKALGWKITRLRHAHGAGSAESDAAMLGAALRKVVPVADAIIVAQILTAWS